MADLWTEARPILAAVAPKIATALGGPVAGLAVAAIGAALGIVPDDAAATALAVAKATPDQLLALKQADQAFAVKLKELDIDLDRLAAQDRDSARRREVDTRSTAPALLAGVVVIGYFGVTWSLFAGAAVIPKEYEMLAGSLLGGLAAALTQVLNYYFGTSKSSADKTQMLDAIIARRGSAGTT